MKTIKKASLLFASLALVLGAGLVGNSDTKEVKAESASLSFVNVDGSASFTKTDTAGNVWTITTLDTKSFTKNPEYIQIGSKKDPATSITLKTTLNTSYKISSFTTKLGGFSGTAGQISVKLDDTEIASGSLNATNDVTITQTTAVTGSVLSMTITSISKGVKIYSLSYDYESSSTPSDPMTDITIENDFKTKSYKQNSQWNVDGLVVKAVYESGNKKELANSDINWSFNKNPSDFEPGTGYSITVTASYKTFSANKIIEGIEILEGPTIYSFNKMKNFAEWTSSYTEHIDYLTFPGLKIVLKSANKQTGTITDVPVTKGNDVEIIVTDNTSISAAAFTFKQWPGKVQTASLFTSTDYGATYSNASVATSDSFSIDEVKFTDSINALKITFSETNQIGLVDFQLRKGKDTVENFVSNWKTFRDNGGNDGICYYLTETNRESLEIMLARYDAFDASDKTTIGATTDVEGVTIGETITYLKNVLAGSTKTNGNYGIKTDSGVVITSNNSYDKTSLIALFAILGIVTISGYYIIEKKKFSK